MISIEFNDDEARLRSLNSLGLLDTPHELEFDQIAKLAAEICATPICLVSLVDDRRQWFKASIGVDMIETPREISFCSHAIQHNGLFVVPDALADARFVDNPLVTGNPTIRFYAGAPLRTPDGHALGTLCVIDTVPRRLLPPQCEALEILASQLMARIELRVRQKQLESILAENERVTAELEASAAVFRLFMNNGPFFSYIKDADGRFVYYNAVLARYFNITNEAWIGLSDEDLFPGEIAREFRRHDLQILAGTADSELIEFTPNPDGTTTPWRSYKFPYTDGRGRVFLAGLSIDITDELRQKQKLLDANARLQKLSLSDDLTGLSNRRAFEGALHRGFALARRHDRELSLLMIDIDDFKLRNDQWGHAAGDAVLRSVAAILADSVRTTDVPARYGGDEFIVLLPETNADSALEMAKRITQLVTSAKWEQSPVTLSIGVHTVSPATLNAEHFVSETDAALYQAKRSGKDGICTTARLGSGLC